MPTSSRSRPLALAIAVANLAACHGRSHTDVYVVGIDGDYGYATVWKNGVAQRLSDTPSRAQAVAVSGDDVFVAGCVTGLGATVWRNGVVEVISASANCLSGIAVSGGDMYVVGDEGPDPVLWTNGVAQVLPHDPIGFAHAAAVAVSGGDVYVAGVATAATSLTGIATLWKNGVAIALSDGSTYAAANAVSVDEGDVYVAGIVLSGGRQVATVWRNGVAQALGDGVANAIAAEAGEVFVAGYLPGASGALGAPSVANVWHGGATVRLSDGGNDASAWAVAKSRAGVYVAGNDGYAAVVWQDGSPLHLTDGSVAAGGIGIAVVPR